MSMTDQAAVKDYIAKYQLEDELSAAVNLAIKQNSDDPFGVISAYLKTLSTAEDYDDEDDDVIEEEDEPMIPQTKPRGRREQVMAVAVEIPPDFKPPVYEKAPDVEEWLKQTIATNKLMKSLPPSDRHQLMQALKEVSFADGEKIIVQGDSGAKAVKFYILDQGTCDISVNGKGTVMKATKGIAFGELALLQNAPRAATVTAEGPVTAWELDIFSFKTILMGKAEADAAFQMGVLSEIDLLADLSTSDKQTLMTSMKEKEYKEKRVIICEGDEGNTFFLITGGEVKCTKVGTGAEVSRRLKKGDFFGELALQSSDKRAATVTATQDTTVLMIDRGAFERVLGTLAALNKMAAGQDRK